MKKRLLCLLLCMVMVLIPMLTACGSLGGGEDETTGEGDEENLALTLTMWLVSEKKVSEDVAEDITNAINSLTRSKYRTQLDIRYFTPDEYRVALDAAMEAAQIAKEEEEAKKEEDKNNGVEIETEEATEAEVETETDVDGVVKEVYKPAGEHQVDIIYIEGEGMYNAYIEEGWLEPLDNEMSGVGKKLKEYVSSSLLSAASVKGKTYAIPNNNIIGEYTYMLLDKTLMDKYSQQGYIKNGEVTGLFNNRVYGFLDMIATFEDPSNVVPIDYTFEECLKLLAYFWEVDPESYEMNELQEFSVFGSYYTSMEEISRGSTMLGYGSLFTNPAFTSNYLQLNKFRYGDEKFGSYFGSAEGKTAAIRFATGDATILDYKVDGKGYEYCMYEGKAYYPVVVKYPTATSDDIYGSMFGITTFTADVERSMEIITYFNTNAEFRNLLQYGVEGVHYNLVRTESGNHTVERRTDRQGNELYVMDLEKTGNIFIAYREPNMSETIWDSGKAQNRNALVDPFLGFDLTTEIENTIIAEPTPTVGRTTGYYLNYTNGYSKAVLSQNETLKAWIEECDQAGAGVYVFKSVENGKANPWKYNYIVYNNTPNQQNYLRVRADEPEYEEIVDEDGNKSKVYLGVDMTFSYKEDPSLLPVDYTLSVVTVYTQKNYYLNITYPSADAKETVHEGFLAIDTTESEDYKLEIYKSMRKSAVSRDADLYAWVYGCGNKSNASYALRYTETVGEEKVETIVALRNTSSILTIDVVPHYENGKLHLKISYSTDDTSATNDWEKYDLTYIRAYVPADVEVTYSIVLNDAAVKVEKETVATVDPDYEIYGDLDTVLVKEMYQLNQDVVAILNACSSYEELTQMVTDLAYVLSTTGQVPTTTKIQNETLKEYFSTKNLTELHNFILDAVSTSKRQPPRDDDDVEVYWNDSEPYIFYSAPNVFYYNWASGNGYLPEDTK